MSTPRPKHVVIVGAGLAGCLMACYLAKAGHRVSVYERRPDPRRAGYVGGRSINLALSARGLRALAGAGLADLVLGEEAIAMPGRMIHPAQGASGTSPSPTSRGEHPLVFQPYSARKGDAIYSVSRGGLNLRLLHAAAAMPGVEFHFDRPCWDVDLDSARPAALVGASVATAARAEGDLVLGCDGAFSPVRARLQKTDRFEYSQSYLKHGYKELHIPEDERGRHLMEPAALHIWPRGGAMMIALPNRDGSFTCTLFWPFEGEHSFEQAPREGVRGFFERHYPDAVPLMPTLEDDFARNPASSLVTVRCEPWQHGGRVAVLGDAAHAIVPFYGQGMNCAFEDCLELDGCLKRHRDTGDALREFQALRKPNADAIAEMALENFVEMRDLAGRSDFQYRKKIEQTLHQHYGDRLTPQYNLVSFSTVPYMAARQRGREMAVLVQKVADAVPAGNGDAWREAVVRAAEPLVGKVTPIEG